MCNPLSGKLTGITQKSFCYLPVREHFLLMAKVNKCLLCEFFGSVRFDMNQDSRNHF
jgi:hypothetical protein